MFKVRSILFDTPGRSRVYKDSQEEMLERQIERQHSRERNARSLYFRIAFMSWIMGYRYPLSVGHIGIPPPINTTHRLVREPDLLLPPRSASAIWTFRCRVETIYFIKGKVLSRNATLASAVATCASVVRARRWTH